MKFAIIPLLFLGLLAGCSSDSTIPANFPVPSQGGVAGDPTAGDIVQVGDKLEIYVLEDESFNGIYTVRDGGHIIFPRVGRVQVAGKSLSAAEAEIKATFQVNILRTATVILERHGSRKESGPTGPTAVTVYLSGQVENPGPIAVPYINGMPPTAYQAIVHGGGALPFAKLSKTYLIRNTGTGRQRIDLNLSDVGKGKSQDVPIQPGDILVVPAKGLF